MRIHVSSYTSLRPSLSREPNGPPSEALTRVRRASACLFPPTFVIDARRSSTLHQSTAASAWWCGLLPRLGWVKMAVGLPEGPSYPGHFPSYFCRAAP